MTAPPTAAMVEPVPDASCSKVTFTAFTFTSPAATRSEACSLTSPVVVMLIEPPSLVNRDFESSAPMLADDSERFTLLTVTPATPSTSPPLETMSPATDSFTSPVWLTRLPGTALGETVLSVWVPRVSDLASMSRFCCTSSRAPSTVTTWPWAKTPMPPLAVMVSGV